MRTYMPPMVMLHSSIAEYDNYMRNKYLCEVECTGSLYQFHSIDGSTETINLLMWVSDHNPSLLLPLKYICHGCKYTQLAYLHYSRLRSRNQKTTTVIVTGASLLTRRTRSCSYALLHQHCMQNSGN